MDASTAIEISKFWFLVYTGAVFGVGLFSGIALMMFCKISANSERRMAKVLKKRVKPVRTSVEAALKTVEHHKANDANNEIAF